MEIRALFEEAELDRIEDELMLKGSRILNVISRSRKPECKKCKCRGSIRKDCKLNTAVVIASAKVSAEEEVETERDIDNVIRDNESIMEEETEENEETGSLKTKKRRRKASKAKTEVTGEKRWKKKRKKRRKKKRKCGRKILYPISVRKNSTAEKVALACQKTRI